MSRINLYTGRAAVAGVTPARASSRCGRALSAVASFLLFSTCAQAQTVHFGYALSTLGSGFSQPTQAAIDASGNLFVTDESNQAVYELTVASGYSTVITLSTQFTIPTGIAVDASDNVYVTDQGTATVNELTASSNYVTVRTLGSGFSNPNGVAVDASGNVFVADTLNNAIKEMVAVSGSIPASPTINTLGGSYNHPTDVAVDSSGNVFVADLFNSAIKEIVAAGGYVTVNTLGSGFSYPVGVALDANDNVYVSDSGNNAIKEILATGGYTTVNTLASSLPYPTGVAVSGAGNVFIANFSGSDVNELTLFGAVVFGSLPVATTTPETIQVNFVFDTSGTIGAPAVLTKGNASLDFADAGTGTCTTNGTSHTYMAGDTCTVAVRFTPTASGARYGAVSLTTSGGVPIATEYVLGGGVGPQVAFFPGTPGSFAGTFLHPHRMAVDAAGNVFVAVAGNVSVGSFVQEVLAAGGYATVNSLGSGYSYPGGVALDGAGNVFVADTYNQAVKEIVAAGGYTTINTIGSGFSFPDDVAVDANGNVFVADTNNNAVKQILAAGGYTTVNTLGSGFSHPNAVAVDASGNVFVADTGNNAVKEILATGGYTTIHTLSPAQGGFYEPTDLALDGNGNLYVLNAQFGFTEEVLAAGGYTTALSLPLSVPQPSGVAVDAKGNVFVTDNQNSQIDELDVFDPPSFTFASTAVGSTSSPQGVEVVNNGNAPLTLEVPATGDNPSVSPGFTYSTASPACPQLSTSSSASTVAVESACAVAVSFTPTVAGSITGSALITDNALNAPGPTYATQSIALSGTAVNPPVTATVAVASAVLTQSNAVTPFIPVTGSGGYGALTYSISPALPAGLNFSSATGTIGGTPAATSAATTYTVTVTDPASITGTAMFTLQVNAAVTATPTAASRQLTQNHAVSAFVPVTGAGGTGTLTYSISPVLPAGLSFASATGTVSGTATAVSPATTYTVTVTDANGARATATLMLTVNASVTATTSVASQVLTQNHAAPAFVPVTGAGGTGVLTYGISPSLPAGLSLASATGTVSGTPTAASAAAAYTITITDSNGATAMAAFTLTVSEASATATATTIASSNPNPNLGTAVVLTATVTPAPTDNPPGTVSFYAGSKVLGSSPLNAAGVATLSIVLPQGSNSITATFSGSIHYAGSTSAVVTVSARAATEVTFSASPTTQLFDNPIVLSVKVTSTTSGTLTGSVTFLDQTIVLSTVAIAANGTASYTNTSLAQGSHTLTATYSGDGNFQASASTGDGVAITVGNINLNLGSDQNQSAVPGAAVSYSFPLSPLVTPTFLYNVQLTATGLPPGATYTFSPATIPAGSGSLPVTFTIQTAKSAASLSLPSSGSGARSSRGLTAVALGLIVPLVGIGRVRKRLGKVPRTLAAILFTAVSLWASLALSGCGGGGFFGPTATSGNYTITVIATSNELVRTSTLQLTIQ